MITEDSTLIDKFISVPKDMHGLNCAALVGGIVEGMLDGAEFVRLSFPFLFSFFSSFSFLFYFF